MSTQKGSENEATLKQLASDIQAGHRHCIDGVRGLTSQAKCIGEWLNEARKLVEHGYWLAWVKNNCNFTPRLAQKYVLVARHYDALVARFNTQDEWTLTEFFAVAGELEAGTRKAGTGKSGTAASTKKARADAFRLEKRQRRKKQKEVEERKQHGPLEVERSEPVRNFLREQCERLLRAIRRFACSREVKAVAGDLEPAHLGILLLDGLKAQLDADELFARPAAADDTDATQPAAPANRVGHHLNGNGPRKKAVA